MSRPPQLVRQASESFNFVSRKHAERTRLKKRKSLASLSGYRESSLWLFSPHNRFRRVLIGVVHDRRFEYLIIFLILLNCIFLAISSPYPLCCRTGEQADGTSATVVSASYFSLPYTDISASGQQIVTDALGGSISNTADLAIRCGVGNSLALKNMSQSEPVWTSLTVDCCVNISAVDVKPDDGVDRPVACADTMGHDIAYAMEWVFTISFTIEMIMKIIAMGCIMEKPSPHLGYGGAYLQNPWNWLDFVVVIISYVSMLPSIDNVSALRTFRVLRPLKTLTAIPGMRTIVRSLFKSLPNMQYVLLLMVFVFLVFGIIAVQLWNGLLHGRCAYLDTISGDWIEDPAQDGRFCGLEFYPVTNYGGKNVSNPFYQTARLCEDRIYGNATWSIKNGTMKCIASGNPNAGVTSFDNIGIAMLWVFTDITLEGWVDNMYAIIDAFSDRNQLLSLLVITYFSLMVMIGSFFMLNLALAVVWDNYQKEDLAEKDKKRRELIEREKAMAMKVFSKLRNKVSLRRKNNPATLPAAAATKPESPYRTGKKPTMRKLTQITPLPAILPRIVVRDRSRTSSMREVVEQESRETRHKVKAATMNLGTCADCYYGLKHQTTRLVTWPWFNHFITFVIIINTIVMAMQYHGASAQYDLALEYSNLTFSVIFFIEMVLKIKGLGFSKYVSDSFNIFDALVVLFSVIEIVLTYSGALADGSGLGVLRSFRLLRVFKLARSWKDLQVLLNMILLSLVDVSSATLLLVVIMFIFALIGMQLFGGLWGPEAFAPDDPPRANFDDFAWSFVTVFQVLTGENWNDVLWAGIKASGGIAVLYFVLLNLLGSYIILNLFLAILLARFEGGETPGEEDDDDDGHQRESAPLTGTSEQKSSSREEGSAGKESALDVSDPSQETEPPGDGIGTLDSHPPDDGATDKIAPLSGFSLGIFSKHHPLRRAVYNFIAHPWFDRVILILIGVSSILLAMDEPWVQVCACYDPNDPSTHAAVCDTSRSVELNAAHGSPAGNSRTYMLFLVYSDLIITIIFVCEMLLKLFGLGVIRGRDAYFRSAWNALDFFIVIVSVVGLATGPLQVDVCDHSGTGEASPVKALRAMRALRALRPLRVVRRFPGMRLVVNSIFKAMPQIGNVLMITFLFFLIFAIIGLQNWMGSIAGCNDESIETLADCVGNFTLTDTACGMLDTPDAVHNCLLAADSGAIFPRRWESKPVNFDDIFHAFLTVFELASGEMWPDIMYDTVDAVGSGKTMVENYNRNAALYHIAVQIVCAFLMLNVFVGVVIEKYNENKEASEGSSLLSNGQKLWLETMKLALTSRAKRRMLPPSQSWRRPVFKFVQHQLFDTTIMVCIGLNTVLMTVRHFDQGEDVDLALEVGNLIFTLIFTAEAIAKLTGLGLQYFLSGWNVFDFILVVLSYVGMAASLPGLASLFRIFRVARMIRLIKTNKGLLNLFKTLIFSIPALVNVGTIVILLMYILACIAMNLFGNIKLQENITEQANFQTFFRAYNTLWRVATGESYNAIMHDAMVKPPYCSESTGGEIDPHASNCGVGAVSPFFFCSTFILINYMLLNLLIAVILDNFTETQKLSESKINDAHLQSFDAAWGNVDQKAQGFVAHDQVYNVLNKTLYPLGLKNVPMQFIHGKSRRKYANQLLAELDLTIIDGHCDYTTLRTALCQRAMGTVELPENVAMVEDFKKMKTRRITMSKKKVVKAGEKRRLSVVTPNTPVESKASASLTGAEMENSFYTARHYVAVTMFQGAWRRHRTRMVLTRWRLLHRNTSGLTHPRERLANYHMGTEGSSGKMIEV